MKSAKYVLSMHSWLKSEFHDSVRVYYNTESDLCLNESTQFGSSCFISLIKRGAVWNATVVIYEQVTLTSFLYVTLNEKGHHPQSPHDNSTKMGSI
jgi:hypothetical protein